MVPQALAWMRDWHQKAGPQVQRWPPTGRASEKSYKVRLLCNPSIKFLLSLVIESIIATLLASLKSNNSIFSAFETGQQIFDPPLIKVVKNCNALSRLIRLMLET